MLLCYNIYFAKHLTQQDLEIKEINELEYKKNQELAHEHVTLTRENYLLDVNIAEAKNMLNSLNKDFIRERENHEQALQNAISSYVDIIEYQGKVAESAYDEIIVDLKAQLNHEKADIQKELEEVAAELASLKATREAAIAASLKEQEIKQKLDFYCVQVNQTELADIQVLEGIKPRLNNPRILSMLIWSTYFQKPMTTLCNNVLGTSTVVGIYKVTNQLNGLCYIGQSVDVSKRWKDHMKCGLGIDTPAGNKLYKDMRDCGVWNFSWELLESCSKEELNDKERFYIELYQSKEFGYNTTKGNK